MALFGVSAFAWFLTLCSYWMEKNPPPRPGETKWFMYDIRSDVHDYDEPDDSHRSLDGPRRSRRWG